MADDDLGFDLGVTGFSIPEIDSLMEALAPEEPDDPADDIVPDEAPARVQPGDIWGLARHRLTCGDSLDPCVVGDLRAGETALMIFAEPPHNVPTDGHVGT
ncbi:MAG: hypothetical protein AAFP13_04725 [Pseudomonadota bacterium]